VGVWLRRCGRAEAPAALATVISAVLLITEIVSMHDLDRIVYRRWGPALLIGWLWVAAALAAAGAAACRGLSSRSVGQPNPIDS
jgi:hypothetical protein